MDEAVVRLGVSISQTGSSCLYFLRQTLSDNANKFRLTAPHHTCELVKARLPFVSLTIVLDNICT